LERDLHERVAAVFGPQVGAEDREVDGRDLVRVEEAIAWQFEEPEVGRDGAPLRPVASEPGVGAQQGERQDLATFCAATTASATTTTRRINRFMPRA
jgi:hypothetical protein